MAIWMDMTNSLTIWQGKIVGIIRAELEIARNLKKECPAVRFSVFADNRFTEIAEEDLNWLFSAGSVTQTYLAKMGREEKPVLPKPDKAKTARDMLLKKYAGALSAPARACPGRRERLVRSVKLLLEVLPERLRPFARLLAKGGYCLLKLFLFCQSKLARPAGSGASARAAAAAAQGRGGETKHPYKPGDVVFSAGWMGSGKEEGFARIKESIPSLRLAYLIYDLIPLREGVCHFYPDEHLKLPFRRYFAWASSYCDLLLYGGETARRDGAAWQTANSLPAPESVSLR
ncbi:MAG: hypothetical protein LBP78_03545, partial [Acidaminococcales bacterium]|nr:hypothetical protein [Acidaminococcales bacterium]